MNRLLGFAAFCAAAAACASEPPVAPPAGAPLISSLSALGVQIYACEAKDGAVGWAFKSPEAKLFLQGKPVGTHYAGPAWKSEDGTSVVGEVIAKATAPDAGAIPWLLLKAKSHEGDGAWAAVAFIRRANTKGGAQPAEGCDAAHIGQTIRVPYEATYELYGAPL